MVTNEASSTVQAALFDDAPRYGDETEFQGACSPMSDPACIQPCTIPASQLPAGGLPSPILSPTPATDIRSPKGFAAFSEWPLEDVVLKRTIIDGRVTFQLQFEWSVFTRHTEELGKRYKQKSRRTPRTTSSPASQGSHVSSRRVKFSSEEDELLRRLNNGRYVVSPFGMHLRPWPA